MWCPVKVPARSLLLSWLIKYDEKENTSPLRMLLYFLSCKYCSENKTARTRVCQLILLKVFIALQPAVVAGVHKTAPDLTAPESHLTTAKPRKRALADYFYPNVILPSKPLSKEIAPLLQKVCPEPRLYFNTKESEQLSMSTSVSLAPAKPGLLFTEGCSKLTVALAVPTSLTWETNSSMNWEKKDTVFTSSLYHAKENGPLKDCSCVKTEVELMDLSERGFSCHRAKLQLQIFWELKGEASSTPQYTMNRLLQC
ncbi:uncharacterized protein LOC114060892 [Empidonax traillii]|uniref:uncharacterized protein LOC114060892 n=1 Tax=Empidonax traillii TaxID=164674 RepID=UPI000FFD30B1|nr:uncharacterized protein LOC114060892 [Empidonax traillii]